MLVEYWDEVAEKYFATIKNTEERNECIKAYRAMREEWRLKENYIYIKYPVDVCQNCGKVI